MCQDCRGWPFRSASPDVSAKVQNWLPIFLKRNCRKTAALPRSAALRNPLGATVCQQAFLWIAGTGQPEDARSISMGGQVFINYAAFHYKCYSAHHGDVFKRISIDADNVGLQAWGDRSNLVLHI